MLIHLSAPCLLSLEVSLPKKLLRPPANILLSVNGSITTLLNAYQRKRTVRYRDADTTTKSAFSDVKFKKI